MSSLHYICCIHYILYNLHIHTHLTSLLSLVLRSMSTNSRWPQVSSAKPFNLFLSPFSSSSSLSSTSKPQNPLQYIYEQLSTIDPKEVQSAINNPSKCSNMLNCMNAMNDVTLEDLGLQGLNLNILKRSFCVTVIETEDFQISAFVLPRGGSLPLHDHPCMAVLSKVLLGNLNVKSYSMLGAYTAGAVDGDQQHEVVLVKDDQCINNNDPAWHLSPTVGNIHEFSAGADEGCVIFDILMPPYREPDRPCNFYELLSDDTSRLFVSQIDEDQNLPYSTGYSGYRIDKR